MPTDLEFRLRRAFDRSVDIAPVPSRVHGAERVHESVRGFPLPHRRRMLVSALSAAAVIAGLVAIASGNHGPTITVPRFQPTGTEFAITAAEPLTPTLPSTTEPDSVHSIAILDHPSLTVYIEAQAINGHVRQYRCLEEHGGGSGCAPDWTWKSPDLGETSTIDNHIGTFNLWTWSNVPDRTAYVVWQSGPGDTMWQVPIAGVSAFPTADDQSGAASAVAYDAAGRVLQRVGSGEQPPSEVDPDGGLVSSLDVADEEQIQRLAATTIDTCLGDGSANTWADCVRIADSKVHSLFLDLGGKLIPYTYPPVCGPGYTASTDGGRHGCYRTPLAPPTDSTLDPATSSPSDATESVGDTPAG